MCVPVAYVNDMVLLVNEQFCSYLEGRAGATLGATVCWAEDNKLTLSKDKMVMSVGSWSVKYVREYKYRGTVLGERMSFMLHAKALRKKAAGLLMKLNRVVRLGRS